MREILPRRDEIIIGSDGTAIEHQRSMGLFFVLLFVATFVVFPRVL